jgi:hypothetical protein
MVINFLLKHRTRTRHLVKGVHQRTGVRPEAVAKSVAGEKVRTSPHHEWMRG